jgi:EEF1A lysine methyltransferase 4
MDAYKKDVLRAAVIAAAGVFSLNAVWKMVNKLNDEDDCAQMTTIPSTADADAKSSPLSPPLIHTTTTATATLATNKVDPDDPIADDVKQYKEKSYWEERFAKETEYEWLSDYAGVRELLRPILTTQSRILVVGCGNSDLSADIYDDGFHNITSIDFSATVIQNQVAKNQQARPEMQWKVMDMLDLEFDNGSFDVVIDKAAMDALTVDEEDPWDPAEHVKLEVDRMCKGISRVLTEAGIFVQISFAQSHFRRKYVAKEEYGWTFKSQQFGSGLGYFFYTMRKEHDTVDEDEDGDEDGDEDE